VPFATLGEFSVFTLVMGRVAGIFAATPMFGGKAVPMRVKSGMVFIMTLVLFPVVRQSLPEIPTDTVSLAILVMRETLIGITLGILSQYIFAAVEFCGQLVGIQVGFSMVNLFDPTMGGQVSVIAVFYSMLATLLFMALGVHHFFIRAIVESYQLLPLGGWHMSGSLLQFMTTIMTGMFVLAMKLAAPVLAAIFATTVVLAIMSRIFPQMNVFIVSMPLNIGVGFLIIGSSLIIFMHTLEASFGQLTRQLKALFKVLG
jgi:flagellar biosynthetic protein FliR